MLEQIFKDSSSKIGFEEFVNFNEKVSSEMFLSLITLMQTSLPCSLNYFRQRSNYVSMMGEDY